MNRMFPVVSEGVAVYVYYEQPRDEYHFLQLKRSRDDDTYGQAWHPVYGGAKPGETAAATARRELLEETGLAPGRMLMIEHLETFFFRPKNCILMLPVFAAQVDATCSVVLNYEHTDQRWISESDVATGFTWRSQRQAISVILDTLRNFPQATNLLEV